MPDRQPWYIHAIGTAVPAQAFTARDAAERTRIAFTDPRAPALLRRVVRLTGIEQRYSAALDFQAPDRPDGPLYLAGTEQPHGPGMGARGAAFDAAAGPLVCAAVAQVPATQLAAVEHLITVSCTHASSPGLELPVLGNFPVPATCHRWNLGFMGCSAGLAALRLVHGLAPGSALVVTCELSSLHFQYSLELDQLTANMLFADGVAAVLLTGAPSAVRLADAACTSYPDAAGQMVWTADDHGLRLRLAPELPETLARHLPAALDGLLARNRLDRRDIAHWLVHPGGPQILDRVAACLALPHDALRLSREVLRTHGNMSSSTILFILRRLVEERREGWCVAAAFGPGLTIELTLLDLRR